MVGGPSWIDVMLGFFGFFNFVRWAVFPSGWADSILLEELKRILPKANSRENKS